MSEHAVSSAVRRKEASLALAETYAALSDEEVIRQVLANHKPSANPIVRIVWIVVGSGFRGVRRHRRLPSRVAHDLVVGGRCVLLRSVLSEPLPMVAHQPCLWLVVVELLSVRQSPAASFKNCDLWADRSRFRRLHLVHHHPRRPWVRADHHRHHRRHWDLVGGLARPQHGLKRRRTFPLSFR